MKKIFALLSLMFLLNGCAESVAFLGSTAGGLSSGKITESSFNSVVSYGVKKQTGKTPIGHAMSYAKEMNPEKKKEPCISFIEKTNSEICAIVKKQISLTKVKLGNKEILNNNSKRFATSLQPVIDKKSKISYLNK
jgi:hypothetical protein|tara:strand:- start:764 stop:1171 length:408 start_codon:yes stop_codon:yes gene_type:complete